MYVRVRWIIAAILACCGVPHCAAAETLESLAARIPGEVNALVLIDVEQIMATPLARDQGWTRKLETAYVERPVFLPPEAKKLVLGAVLQPQDDFLAARELAVMELAAPVAVRSIARSESGYVDQLNGQTTAFTPRDAAFVDLGNNILAVARPADRQFLSRWISFARDNPRPELSEYLRSALPRVNDRVQMLLAVDLTDVLGPRDVETRLAEPTSPATKNADVPAIAEVLGKLRGATLRIAVGDDCRGQLQIDFGADVAPLGDMAKPLVLQAMTNLGLNNDEFSHWDVSLAPRSIRMQGVLSADAQRRVFSVIELPAADLGAGEASPGDAGQESESEVRDRSLAYFQSSQVLVNDLRKGLKDTKATSAWMERYARRIDELPVLHVDEVLLDYGDKLAETLRIMSLSKRQAGIAYGVRATEGGGYYDGYNYGEDAYTRAAGRSQVRKEEMAVASDTRVQGWQLIDDATADIRRTLTKKYSVEF